MFSGRTREHDAFELFGEEIAPDPDAREFDFAPDGANAEHAALTPPDKVKQGFSWAGFAGGLASATWLGGASAIVFANFGLQALAALDPAAQLGLAVAAIAPALLFWVVASAAGEAFKARRIAAQFAASRGGQSGLSEAAKHEIGALLDRALAHALEGGPDPAAPAAMGLANSRALQRERNALIELNADLRTQTETMANAIGRQIRLLRETSKLVKGEVAAAQNAIEAQLAALKASATVVGERTAAFHVAADSAAAASSSLSEAMTRMLEGLSEATRLADSARVSSEHSVLAANETANALHKTTRSAVEEAKRAAKLIRAETVALQNAPAELIELLQEAAGRARASSEESLAAASRHSAAAHRRATTRSTAARGSAASRSPSEDSPTPLVFGSPGALRNFKPLQNGHDLPAPANEDGCDLLRFVDEEDRNETLERQAMKLVVGCGVNLHASLPAEDLDRVARSAVHGPGARRGAVLDLAQNDVRRIARCLARDSHAREIARRFRGRPDLAKSEDRRECSDLVRAYLLIDAALA